MEGKKSETASCGRDLNYVANIESSLQSISQQGFDFLCVPIVHPRFEREFVLTLPPRPGPLTRSDMCLSSSDWTVFVVGKLSPWINLDSDVPGVRTNSEKAFMEEMKYAVHLSLPAIMMKLKTIKCVNFARCVYQLLNTRMCASIWIQVPMMSPKNCTDYINTVKDEEQAEDTWEWWNIFRSLCDNHKMLGLALEVSKDLPPENELDRWLGEPIKVGILSTDIFLLNKKGYPVLPKAHQVFITKLFKLNIQLVLTGSSRVDKGIHSYKLYLDHLYQLREADNGEDEFCKGYEDYLQCPLQPLMDNLESQTYEVFEKDPVKYSQYQKAIYEALLDRVSQDEAATKIRLRNLQLEEWGNDVTVVSCDMRKWQAPEKADIMVSELLGSFGDNELSPECLDGAQSFLKHDGISIPCSYTSYVVPISSPKLHADLTSTEIKQKGNENFYEMLYVVRLKNVHFLSDVQPCFTFVHPKKDIPTNNERFCCLKFPVTTNSTVHGFAGFFDAVLYNQINISIAPANYSKGMFSWFPVYIPIKNPFYVKNGQDITFNIWRVVTEAKVWYEWAVSTPTVSHVHNIYGQSQWIGL
ncbi:protein arginine N-methyltransferase 5-like isoform X2 [Dysidea avara]|uniref:protein arginine N-methyltransferase 5-like isoform X2 n=1 Tax=Dysidea avara TaxID=196820 RepID=UPI00332012DE